MVRVRNEFRNQLNAYQSLYDSSIGYGMRHALTAEQTRSEIYSRVADLKNEVEQLEEQVDKLNQETIEIVNEDEKERRELEEAHSAFRKDIGLRLFKLKDQLDTVLSDPNMI